MQLGIKRYRRTKWLLGRLTSMLELSKYTMEKMGRSDQLTLNTSTQTDHGDPKGKKGLVEDHEGDL